MAESRKRGEAVQRGRAETHGDAVDLRFRPLNGKDDSGVEERVKVECAICIFPGIIRVDQEDFAELLLYTGIVLVAPRWSDRRGSLRPKGVLSQPAGSRNARKN